MFCENRHHVFLPVPVSDLGEESLQAAALSGEETGLLLGGFAGLDPPDPSPGSSRAGRGPAHHIVSCV